jgi:Flp pilus assembly protein TadG
MAMGWRLFFRKGASSSRKRARILFPSRSALMRKRSRISGSTAVEMALIAPVFFFMLMGMVETTMMLTAQQLLENASFNTSRLAKTGYTAAGQTQGQTVSQILVHELQSFGTFIDTTKVILTDTTYTSFSGIGNDGTNGMGKASQIVVYTVTYPWQMFTPMIGMVMGTQDANGNWVINLTSRIVVRNEPYG